jgi:polyphosphate kinase
MPVTVPALKARVLREALDLALDDNTNAWILDPDGNYTRIKPGKAQPSHTQTILLAKHGLNTLNRE